MPDPNDDALAATAVGLNEDSKAKRRKTPQQARADAAAHLGTSSGPPLAPGERWHEGELLAGFSFDAEGYVVDEDGERTGARRVAPEGSLSDALADLGAAVDQQPDAGTAGYDLSEGAHRLAVDRIEGLVMDRKFDGKTLVLDVRDTMLDIIKARPKPWSATSNGEQNDIAAALEQAAIKLVRRIVETVTANGKEPARMLLTKLNIGDDIIVTGKLKVMESEAEDDAVRMLHHARGKHVLLIPASVDDYRQTDRAADTMPDQPDLGFEAGKDEHPDDDSDLAGGDDDA